MPTTDGGTTAPSRERSKQKMSTVDEALVMGSVPVDVAAVVVELLSLAAIGD